MSRGGPFFCSNLRIAHHAGRDCRPGTRPTGRDPDPAARRRSGAEGARLLNISESSFWRLVHTGKIAKVDLSGTGKSGRGRGLWRFRESALWAYVDDCTRVEASPGPEPAPLQVVTGREAL